MCLLLKGLSHEMDVYLLLRRVRKRGAASTQLPATSPPYIHQSSSLLLSSARYRYHLVPLVPYLRVKPSTGIFCTFPSCSGSRTASIRIDFALLGAVDPDPEGAWKLT